MESAGYDAVVNAINAASPRIYDTSNYYDTPSYIGYHDVSGSDFSSDGSVSWFGAQAFTGYLNSISYAGPKQWALPSAGADPQYGYNQTGGQFGQLFYNELGGTAGNAIPDTPYFTNEQAYAYWLGTEYAPDPVGAWAFGTNVALQSYGYKYHQFYAWAVSPGNVAAVPVPGAIWVFGSGLLALLGLKRRGNIG
jgi:hypothetical protein